MGPMTREEYEREAVRKFMARYEVNEDEARKELEKQYPMCTSRALIELTVRGLDSSEWRILGFCDQHPDLAPRIVGGSRAWGKTNIDAFADYLEARGDLLPAAAYRKEMGLSWAREQEFRNRLEAERKEAVHAQ